MLAQAAAETRLFQRHQQERAAAGLPPERGWQAALYHGLLAAGEPLDAVTTGGALCVALYLAWLLSLELAGVPALVVATC